MADRTIYRDNALIGLKDHVGDESVYSVEVWMTGGSINSPGTTEYTEGDVDASITGTAIMWEDAGNVLSPVSAAKPLPVDVTSGSVTLNVSDIEIGAVEIKDGDSDVRLDVELVTAKNAAYTRSEAGAHADLVSIKTAVEAIDNTVYTEDSPHNTEDEGTFVLAVRNDSGSVMAHDGDYIPLVVDANGRLYVNAEALDKDTDEVLVWANTAKDGSGTDYVPLVDGDGHLQIDVLSGTVVVSSGSIDITGIAAGSNIVGKVGIDQTTPGTTNRIDIGNIANTTQTNDVKVTLDSEAVVLGAGEAHAGEVGGKGVVVSTTITRPADVTAYAAKDAVSDSTGSPAVLTFSNVARINNGSGYIVKARLMSSGSADTERFRLHLFSVAPTPINDNSPYTLLYANAANRIGSIDFPALGTEGTGSTASNSIATPGSGNLPLHFVTAAADRSLYGLSETLDAFTPASAQTFFIELSAELD